jgi:predicted ArsR family transcriptional regulator
VNIAVNHCYKDNIYLYNYQMQATRQRILDYLDQRGATTARKLAQAFGMTPANLRRHLAILQQRDLVHPVGRVPAEGRGRPELTYATVASSTLEPLVSALLTEVEVAQVRTRPAAIKRLAVTLLGSPPAASGQQSKRLLAAVQKLTPLGYKPSWEARPSGPQVVLGRCPYASIIADHPILCQLDAQMLETMLGSPVDHTIKLQPGPHGLPQCVFITKRSQ